MLEIEERYNEIDLQKGIYNPPNRQWQTSGPFSIDRHEYILGEKIFMIAEGIPFDQKGQIVFLRALNSTTYQVWKSFDYDGSMKSAFNIYFEPVLDENLEICFKEDLIGEWVIKFRNTDYENLSFSILDAILPGDEDKFDINKCQ